MDFTKFVSMLSTGALYFARSDHLGDPFEGSRPRPDLAKKVYAGASIADGAEYAHMVREVRKIIFVNCWHANRGESAAMWKLYAKADEAVAVRTTYARLRDALPENVALGVVKYIDYEKDSLPSSNMLTYSMHKRLAFAHENEVRGLYLRNPGTELSPGGESPQGELVHVDLALLVEQVCIAPAAPAWYFKLVESVINHYGQHFAVTASSLDAVPSY